LSSDAAAEVGTITKLMAKPYPAPSEVSAAATRLRDSLDLALKSQSPPANAASVYDQLMRLTTDGLKPDVVGDWEHATQRYLAIAAHAQCLADLNPASRTSERRAALLATRADLAFPATPRRFDSPSAFSPDAFRKLLRDVDESFAPKR
jgi:hypothetical protein